MPIFLVLFSVFFLFFVLVIWIFKLPHNASKKLIILVTKWINKHYFQKITCMHTLHSPIFRVQWTENSMGSTYLFLIVTGFWKSVLMSNFKFQIFTTKIRNGNFQSPQQWLKFVVPTLNYQKIIGNTVKSSVVLLMWSQ